MLHEKQRSDGEYSNINEHYSQWLISWQLPILMKTRNFYGGYALIIFPLNTICQKEKVLSEGNYPTCITELETIVHMLWNRNAVNDV